MIGLIRLLTLGVALLALVGLSAHRMDAAPGLSTTVMAEGSHDGHEAPTGPAERSTCQMHCLAAAVTATGAPQTPATTTGSFASGAPVRLDGLSPPPLGPPPKLPASA